MIIRKIEKNEVLSASLISVMAFHSDIDDLEKFEGEVLKSFKGHSWGAFLDDGKIVARIVDHRETSRFDGCDVLSGCIGGVCTLPEYRNQGIIREMLKRVLRAEYDDGVVVSSLYPFNHAFYRKFGYELIYMKRLYRFPVSALKGYRHDGWAKMWNTGDSLSPFTKVYNAFSARYNLSFYHDDEYTSETIYGEYYKDKHFCYLLGDDSDETAYVAFNFKWDNKRIIEVEDLAFIGSRGLNSLLGFLARFTADYDEIRMALPPDVDLTKLVENPYAVDTDVKKEYMARIVNVQRALEIMKKPDDADFTIQISDDILPENRGTWRVTNEGAERTDAAPDIRVSEKAFTVLALGFTDIDEAVYRPDVDVLNNTDMLRRMFIEKPAFTLDHF